MKYFKLFETRYLNGLGSTSLSRALSDTPPEDTKTRSFFFGKRTNLQVMCEFCIISKLDIDETPEQLDEADFMRLED